MHTFSVTPVRDVDCLARTHELLAKQKYSTFSNIKCNDQSVLSDVLIQWLPSHWSVASYTICMDE